MKKKALYLRTAGKCFLNQIKNLRLGEKPPEEEKVQEKAEQKEPPPHPPLPEVNFSTFIISLSTEVLFHLGEFPHPVSGEKQKDLPLAKHAIDTLAMLKEKTQGNLSDEEQQLLEGMLYDLRMAFIRTS